MKGGLGTPKLTRWKFGLLFLRCSSLILAIALFFLKADTRVDLLFAHFLSYANITSFVATFYYDFCLCHNDLDMALPHNTHTRTHGLVFMCVCECQSTSVWHVWSSKVVTNHQICLRVHFYDDVICYLQQPTTTTTDNSSSRTASHEVYRLNMHENFWEGDDEFRFCIGYYWLGERRDGDCPLPRAIRRFCFDTPSHVCGCVCECTTVELCFGDTKYMHTHAHTHTLIWFIC